MNFQNFVKVMLIAQILANSSEKSSEKEPTNLNENLLNGVQLELEKRNSKAIRTVIQFIEQDGQDMKKD